MDDLIRWNTPQRSIKLVYEPSAQERPQLRLVGPLLDNLDASGLVQMRFKSFACGHCSGRVNLRVTSVASSGVTGGQRAFFAHAIGKGEYCTAITGQAFSSDVIDTIRYHGLQEGERHQFLKTTLADAIASDPFFLGADVEVSFSHDGERRRPDVVAQIENRFLCFDVQISPPLRATISGRASFYDRAPLPHLWVLDGADHARIELQGFQDVVFRQGAKCVAWDEECIAESSRRKSLTMKLLTVSDHGSSLKLDWKWLSTQELLNLAGIERTPSPKSRDLIALAFFDLLAAGDIAALERWYSVVLEPGLGLPWKALRRHGVLPAIGALASIIDGGVRDGSKRQPAEVGAVINNACTVGLHDQRHVWAPLLAATLNMPEAKLARSRIGRATPGILKAAVEASSPPELNSLQVVYAPILNR